MIGYRTLVSLRSQNPERYSEPSEKYALTWDDVEFCGLGRDFASGKPLHAQCSDYRLPTSDSAELD